MASNGFWHFTSRALCIFAAAAILVGATPGSTGSPTANVLYSFSGGNDGGYPDTDLVADGAGNVYGTSVEGGDFDAGAVFKLAPSSSGWTETVLYSFTGGADGGEPYGGVTLDAQGNLYGTAVVGGRGGTCDGGCGVAFRLANSGGTYSFSVLHNFIGGNDGTGPGAGLTFDKFGNLYGMTPTGGADGFGVIYQLHANPNGKFKERVIHTFTGGDDGATGSAGRLVPDNSGNFYGVATVGGANGAGVAFRLSGTPNGQWALETLYAFKGQPDAGFPYGALTFDAAGNLYGTTYYAGANDVGSVYKLSLVNGAWEETVLHSFAGGADGSGPISNLVVDVTGKLYGTTSEGGAGCSCGTIFRLAARGDGPFEESVVYRFRGAPDGAFAYNGMVADAAGHLYGATVHGGVNDEGAIYQFTP